MSIFANNKPCPPISTESGIGEAQISKMQSRIIDLEQQIECQEKTNTELSRRLSEEHDMREEESFRRQMLEFDLNQHKEAITEMLGELRQRDQTVEVQNGLLRASWLDGQALAASQRQTIQLLQGKIDDLSTNGNVTVQNKKKRKFSE
ncbi:hypothetical protein NQ176_g5074 [Zarea fungicola]|uniref:Uncharacterized protein n=1 Tax=Zarea fungicola TaxID=93591 RepID=A0ACC1NAD6_9HYPO|nr:hypothetical protein NQ176_g5074 [Lecanicillium fungicola]